MIFSKKHKMYKTIENIKNFRDFTAKVNFKKRKKKVTSFMFINKEKGGNVVTRNTTYQQFYFRCSSLSFRDNWVKSFWLCQ